MLKHGQFRLSVIPKYLAWDLWVHARFHISAECKHDGAIVEGFVKVCIHLKYSGWCAKAVWFSIFHHKYWYIVPTVYIGLSI